MRKILSLREVLCSDRSSHDGWALCATADAKYDMSASTVQVELDSLVQPSDLPPGVNGLRQPWLPAREIVRRRVPLQQARAVARDLFRRWIAKVERTVPLETRHRAD